MKLIVLSAGLGKRFLPTTNTTPKGMVPVLDEPLLKHVVEPYLPYVSDIIFVVNSAHGPQIKDYFKKSYEGHKVFYKTQADQLGTMDALLTCKDLIKDRDLFCVANGDDLLKESDIQNAINQKTIGVGVAKRIMPKSYLGVRVEDGQILGFVRHADKEENRKEAIQDVFYNGFNILDHRVFHFQPISTRDGELGLPHTLFANLDTYPLKAFFFESWETVNRPTDIPKAQKFIKK